MTHVIFYEKPGCKTNARQRAMLEQAGHEVERRSLLTEKWTAQALQSFLGALPVSQWFNLASPRVKSGEILPAALDGPGAIALMLADPLLIRRPLMEAGGWRVAGFDVASVDEAIGLELGHAAADESEAAAPLEGCAHGDSGKTCPPRP